MIGTAADLAKVKEEFPNLCDTAHITSPPDYRYNCIAYAAGDMRRKWWPDAWGIGYWPPDCLRIATLPVFQMAFSTLGYNLCAGGMPERGLEKIAIFHQNNVPSHAAKLLQSGFWSSKLGDWFDISHRHKCLCGRERSSYGEIAFFMSRPAR